MGHLGSGHRVAMYGAFVRRNNWLILAMMAVLVAVVRVLDRPAGHEDPPRPRPPGRPADRLHGQDVGRQGADPGAARPGGGHPRQAGQRPRRHASRRSRSRAPTRSPWPCPASPTPSRRSTSSARPPSCSSSRTTPPRGRSVPCRDQGGGAQGAQAPGRLAGRDRPAHAPRARRTSYALVVSSPPSEVDSMPEHGTSTSSRRP